MSAPAELRALLFRLIWSVALLDAVAIGLYYAVHVRARSHATQIGFGALWLVLTLWVVLSALARIRAARTRERHRRRTGS